jgi:hypothetical protein
MEDAVRFNKCITKEAGFFRGTNCVRPRAIGGLIENYHLDLSVHESLLTRRRARLVGLDWFKSQFRKDFIEPVAGRDWWRVGLLRDV